MESESQTEVSAEAAWRAQQFSEVARIVLTDYGPELYGFLLAQFRGQSGPADDVFSVFSEDFWRGLPAFQWRCSIRAWCYRLARSAASRHRRSPQHRREWQIPLSEAARMQDLIVQARTTTQLHVRSEVRDKIRELRDKLSRDDQDLLILRIDRDLAWRDVVHAMWTGEPPPTEEQVRRMEVTLRQRFTEVKKRLKQLATAAGLL